MFFVLGICICVCRIRMSVWAPARIHVGTRYDHMLNPIPQPWRPDVASMLESDMRATSSRPFLRWICSMHATALSESILNLRNGICDQRREPQDPRVNCSTAQCMALQAQRCGFHGPGIHTSRCRLRACSTPCETTKFFTPSFTSGVTNLYCQKSTSVKRKADCPGCDVLQQQL